MNLMYGFKIFQNYLVLSYYYLLDIMLGILYMLFDLIYIMGMVFIISFYFLDDELIELEFDGNIYQFYV